MKLFATIAAALLLLTTHSAHAQGKIGTVDIQGIFASLPQAAMIQQTLDAEFRAQTEEVTRIERDLQFQLQKRQRDAVTMSENEKAELDQQIAKLRQEYEAKAKPLQADMQRRAMEEQNKILAMIQQAIDQVYAEGNYAVILNSSGVVASNPDNDVSQRVIDIVSGRQ